MQEVAPEEKKEDKGKQCFFGGTSIKAIQRPIAASFDFHLLCNLLIDILWLQLEAYEDMHWDTFFPEFFVRSCQISRSYQNGNELDHL